MTIGTGIAIAAMWGSMLGIVYLMPTVGMAITVIVVGTIVTLWEK